MSAELPPSDGLWERAALALLPVLDLRQGQVVRAVAGRREEYRPLVSRLTESTDPLDVAAAIHGRFNLNRLYVADLDAIEGREPQWDLLQRLADAGFELTVDAGVRTRDRFTRLEGIGIPRIVVGLESVTSPAVFENIASHPTAGQLGFSLDLRDGLPMADPEQWPTNPLRIVDCVKELVDFLIVLDLAAVGIKCGPRTQDLCSRIRAHTPGLRLITGGGARSLLDADDLIRSGVDEVLMSSALHDGSLDAAWPAL